MRSLAEVITPAALRDWRLPDATGSKHSRGHVVVVGGSPSTPGAVLLAGIASLRVGAGVLAMAVPEAVAIPLAIAVPEASAIALEQGLEDIVGQADAVLIGPGTADPKAAKEQVSAAVDALPENAPLLLDAFALGVLPEMDGVTRNLGERLLLTPNSAEAARLLGDKDGDPGDDAAQRIAEKWQATVSFQGQVASPDGSHWQVATGHAGLGTSGSGDVLSGTIVGLLARGAGLTQAACWGTYLHAAAGDRLAARVGRLGFLARELNVELPLVLTELQS